MSTGWECPRCGATWAPWVARCAGDHSVASSSGNITVLPSATYPQSSGAAVSTAHASGSQGDVASTTLGQPSAAPELGPPHRRGVECVRCYAVLVPDDCPVPGCGGGHGYDRGSQHWPCLGPDSRW